MTQEAGSGPPTTAVLLAAGSGSRLGRGPKALLPFHGSTLVEHAATALRDGGCANTVVVLGSGAARLAALAAVGPSAGQAFAACRLVVNEGWASGMGSSFRLGVAAVEPGHNVLVALVDQPGVTAGVIARLLAGHQQGRITAAGYAQAAATALLRGHPIIFSPPLAAAAAALSEGDAGARAFLRAHPELIDVVDCSDLGDGADLDTPADLHLLD